MVDLSTVAEGEIAAAGPLSEYVHVRARAARSSFLARAGVELRAGGTSLLVLRR